MSENNAKVTRYVIERRSGGDWYVWAAFHNEDAGRRFWNGWLPNAPPRDEKTAARFVERELERSENRLGEIVRTLGEWRLPEKVLEAVAATTGVFVSTLKAETVRALGERVDAGREKFPEPRNLLVALMEELGELSQAFLQGRREDARSEALDVAALALRVYEEAEYDPALLPAAITERDPAPKG